MFNCDESFDDDMLQISKNTFSFGMLIEIYNIVQEKTEVNKKPFSVYDSIT